LSKSVAKSPDLATSSAPIIARGLVPARAALEQGLTSCIEATRLFIEEIRRRERLNAYVRVTADLAHRQAAESDQRIAAGKPRPLEGLGIAIKDNFCVKDVETTACSRILEGFCPTYDAGVVARLRSAGAVILGMTNMDEFGMGSSTENSRIGPALNPRGEALGLENISPGGSSGGAAAAVAANLCFGAIGTDTGGSIRQPASFCGIVGFKPTYGLCSRWGIIAYASSMDQAGVLTRTVEDAACMLDAIVGEDPRDSTSYPWTGGSFEQGLAGVPKKMKVGFPAQFRTLSGSDDLERTWSEAQRRFAGLGCEIKEVSLPTISYALPTYYILVTCEASSNLARYDGVRYGLRGQTAKDIDELYETTRAQGFGWEAKRRILLGTFALSAGYYDQYYNRARKVRHKIADEFAHAFADVDVLFWPTTPTPAFPLGSHAADPVSMYLEDVFTVPVNLAGLPAVSIPVTTAANGLPMGLTIAGPQNGDLAVLRAARAIEQAG
jgi:aspartyl-tRNA(Asn)/glutamyl-tRNA(Gln) amidotransferase subunit A